VDARHKAGHDDLLYFNGFVMAGLVPAIHAVAGIPLVACHGAFFRILLELRIDLDTNSRSGSRLGLWSTVAETLCSAAGQCGRLIIGCRMLAEGNALSGVSNSAAIS
jgi:hypothetical protein